MMVDPAKRKNSSKNSDGLSLSDSVSQEKKGNAEALKVPALAAPATEQTARPVRANDDFKDIPKLPTNPIRTSKEKSYSKNETMALQSYVPFPTTEEDSAAIIPSCSHNVIACEDLSLKRNDRINGDSLSELTLHPVPSIDSDGISMVRAKEEPSDDNEVELPHSPELQMFSSPPPAREITPEQGVHFRKNGTATTSSKNQLKG